MAMALYIALYFNLDKPYWAVVSAVFLQIRPEGGMVVEKNRQPDQRYTDWGHLWDVCAELSAWGAGSGNGCAGLLVGD